MHLNTSTLPVETGDSQDSLSSGMASLFGIAAMFGYGPDSALVQKDNLLARVFIHGRSGDQSHLTGQSNCMGAVLRPQLQIDAAQMGFDRGF